MDGTFLLQHMKFLFADIETKRTAVSSSQSSACVVHVFGVLGESRAISPKLTLRPRGRSERGETEQRGILKLAWVGWKGKGKKRKKEICLVRSGRRQQIG
jgi:hypothetical protein